MSISSSLIIGESVPDGIGTPTKEPEMAQEPAGPDQSLPIASEPDQPPLPRGRTATSYINVSVIQYASMFFLPMCCFFTTFIKI